MLIHKRLKTLTIQNKMLHSYRVSSV